MEDILASIRRIIADDQSQGGRSAYAPSPRRPDGSAPTLDGDHASDAGQPAAARARTPYDDVLDLARLMPGAGREPVHSPAVEVEDPGGPAQDEVHLSYEVEMETVSARDDAVGTALAAQPPRTAAEVSSLRARLPEPAARDGEDADHPSSPEDGDADGELLAEPLGASVMSAFETLAATVVLENTPMLERVMRDLLRPLLKTWLDDNLPGLVERLVRNEIERVARGGRA